MVDAVVTAIFKLFTRWTDHRPPLDVAIYRLFFDTFPLGAHSSFFSSAFSPRRPRAGAARNGAFPVVCTPPTHTLFFFFFFCTLSLSSFWTSRGHRCRPFSSPVLAFNFFIAHRVQQFHCSSIFHRVLLTHALALSASQFVHKKKSQRIYTSMHSAGLELTKLTYTRLEDNLIRHRGDRLVYIYMKQLAVGSASAYNQLTLRLLS